MKTKTVKNQHGQPLTNADVDRIISGNTKELKQQIEDPYYEFMDDLGLKFDERGLIHIGAHGLRKILKAFNKEVEAEARRETARQIYSELNNKTKNVDSYNIKGLVVEYKSINELKQKYLEEKEE